MPTYFASREEYRSTREGYASVAQESSKLFDHTLITLCVGAIGGSVYFATEKDNLCVTWILLIGWVLLAICVAVTIWSFKVSEDANWCALKQIDAMFNNGDTPVETEINEWKEKVRKKSSLLKKLERWGIWLLISGISSVGIFIYLNLGHTMNDVKRIDIRAEGIQPAPIDHRPTPGPAQTTTQGESVTKGVQPTPIHTGSEQSGNQQTQNNNE